MTAPNEILTPGTHLWRADVQAIGAQLPDAREDVRAVVIHAQGRFRRARVLTVGPKRTTVEYGTSGTPRRSKAVPHALVYTTNEPEYSLELNRYAVVRQADVSEFSSRRAGGQYLEGGEDL